MTIYQGLTTSFKQEMLQGVHDLSTDTIKIALYTSDATLDAATTIYTTTGEVSAGAYMAGGVTLTGATIASGSGVVYVTFNNAVWDPAGFVARGALIYNMSKGGKSVAVLDFGMDKIGATTFTVVFPVASATTALLRF
jgi:hypothetical protein